MENQLLNYLNKHNIQYSEYNHPPMFKVSDEKKSKANIPGEKSKNLFLRDNNGKFYLIIWHAYSKLPISDLKRYLKVKDLEFASPEELKKHLNTSPGSVSIFAMIHAKNVSLLIDKRLWIATESGYHPNENTSTLVLPQVALHNFVNSLNISYEVIDIE